MKILYVITGGDVGGAQKHVYYMAKWFLAKGHEVQVVVGENGPFVDILAKENICVTIISIPRKIKLKKDIIAILKVYRFLKNGKFDIIHSHSSKAGIIARIAGFLNHTKKNIYTAHGYVFTDPTLSKRKKTIYLLLEKICSLISTDIITVSKYDYEKAMEHGLNHRKIHIVYNGTPAESFITTNVLDKKIRSLQNRNKMIIGFVGRFASEKNIDMILRVASLYKMNNKENVEFWLIGDGPLFNYYNSKIEEQELSAIIHLKGHQHHILSWMDKMNILIITSHKEGLPFVLLEALSRGLPVVSTDAGGIKEVVDPDGQKDVIVPINDDLRMYNKLNCLLQDDSLYHQLAKDALRIVSTLTVENMCMQTEEIYCGKQEFLTSVGNGTHVREY